MCPGGRGPIQVGTSCCSRSAGFLARELPERQTSPSSPKLFFFFLILPVLPIFFPTFPSPQKPIHTYQTTHHGSRDASGHLGPEVLVEGSLACLPQRCLQCRPLLLVQEPGTPIVGPEPPPDHPACPIDHVTLLQTLKERFAELLPEKIEQIKTLRKYVLLAPQQPILLVFNGEERFC
jgi:hypothetical protein